MYISSWWLIHLILGGLWVFTALYTKTKKFDNLTYGIKYLVKYVNTINQDYMHFHNIVYDKEIKDYFLVLYDKDFFPVTIRLYSISEFNLDCLYNETNIYKRKQYIISFLLKEVSSRIEYSTSNLIDKVVEYDDYCSTDLQEKLKLQILSKKTNH